MEITTPQHERRGLARRRLMVGQGRRVGLVGRQMIDDRGDILMNRRPRRLTDGVHSLNENRQQRQELEHEVRSTKIDVKEQQQVIQDRVAPTKRKQ